MLHLLVEVGAEKHAKNAEQIHFNAEAERQLEKNQVYGEGRIDAGRKVARKNILNGAVRGHDAKNFTENPAKHPADQDEHQQNAHGFSHQALPLRPCVVVPRPTKKPYRKPFWMSTKCMPDEDSCALRDEDSEDLDRVQNFLDPEEEFEGAVVRPCFTAQTRDGA
jgi:hypothetical protein